MTHFGLLNGVLQQYEELCNRIVALDRSVRFVGLVDHLGSLLTTVYRKGLTPLASKEETANYAHQAVFMTGALGVGRNSKIGKMQYVVGKYENLVRATIPVVSGSYDKFYLLLSFDTGADVIPVIENKILPFIEQKKGLFA
jgi:hypothetical protein